MYSERLINAQKKYEENRNDATKTAKRYDEIVRLRFLLSRILQDKSNGQDGELFEDIRKEAKDWGKRGEVI